MVESSIVELPPLMIREASPVRRPPCKVARNSDGNAWSQHNFDVMLSERERKYNADDSNIVMSRVLDRDDIPKILCSGLVPAAPGLVSSSVVEMMIEN
jgi:hypothetical protein